MGGSPRLVEQQKKINSPSGNPQDQQDQNDQEQLNAQRKKQAEQQGQAQQQGQTQQTLEQSVQQREATVEGTVSIQGVSVTTEREQGTEPQAQGTVQAPAKNMSMLRRMSSGLPVHIPTSAAEPLEEYHFYEQSVSSMWRPGWFSDTPAKNAARMKRHVDRFMCSSEITEKDVSKMSTTVLSSAGLLDLKRSSANLPDPTKTAEKMAVLDKLKDDTEGASVAEILENNIDLLKAPEISDVPWDDPYYKQHPACARVLIMMNIIENVDHKKFNVSGFLAETRLEDRFEGLKQNLAPLCTLIKNSDEYVNARERSTGFKTLSRQLGITEEQKKMYEQGIKDRVNRLDKAMSRMYEYKRSEKSDTTDTILKRMLKLLELNEEDINTYRSFSDTDAALMYRTERYLDELSMIREYFAEGTKEERLNEITSHFGLNSTRKKRKDKFYGSGLRSKLKEFGVLKEKPQSADESKEEIEATYPPEVIEGVKMVDQWIAAHAMDIAASNTESNYAADILQKPFSQRLFAYYLLEKGQRKQPNSACVMLSQNGYVPNMIAIKGVLNASKWKFWLRPVSFLKGRSSIKNTWLTNRALGTMGHVYLKKLEDTMRILDDKEAGFVDKIERAKKERQANKTETDELFLKRHDAGIECVKAIEEYRAKANAYLSISTHSRKKEMETTRQAACDAYKKLVEANDLIKDRYQVEKTKKGPDSDEITKKLNQKAEADGHTMGLSVKEMAESKVRDHMSIEDKIDTGYGLSSTLVGATATVTGKVIDFSNQASGITVWNLSSQQLFNSVMSAGVFNSLAGGAKISQGIFTLLSIPKEVREGGAVAGVDQLFEGLEQLASGASTYVKGTATMLQYGKVVEKLAETDKDGKLKNGFGDAVGALKAVKIASGVKDGVEIATSVKDLIKIKVSSDKQVEGAQNAQDIMAFRAEFARMAGEADIEQKMNDDQRKVANIRKMQHRANSRRTQQAAFKMASSTLNILGTFVPGAQVLSTVSTVISIGASVKEFYDKLNESDSAIDDYIHMDELLEEYKKEFTDEQGNVDEEELQAMADEVLTFFTKSRRDNVFRDEIRQAVLREMGFSSYAEMADSVAEDYCTTVYDIIFKREDGTLIGEDDPEADLEEELIKSLVDLFAPLTFKYPKLNDKREIVTPGKPTIAKMKDSLLK